MNPWFEISRQVGWAVGTLGPLAITFWATGVLTDPADEKCENVGYSITLFAFAIVWQLAMAIAYFEAGGRA
jgi:hypothetical protein